MTPRGAHAFSLRTRLVWGALLGVLGALAAAGAVSSEVLGREHGADLDPTHLARHRSWTLGLGTAAAALLVTGGLALRSGLRPLTDLESRLSDVRRGAHRRLEGDFPSEVAGVVAELNALLERSERHVAEARSEASALAHALKTPLAVLEGEVDRLEESGESEVARRLRDQLAGLRQQVEWRLLRARAAERARDPGARCDATPTVARVVDTLRRLHSASISCDAPAQLVVACDREDLEEIAGNLIDNACKWCRGSVAVSLASEAGRATLTVDDDGPGLDADARTRVFQRGTRLDTATPGSGFGLAIARELAEAYGGRIELSESPNGGLRAQLVLETI